MLKIAHLSAFHFSRLTMGVVDVLPHMDVIPHPTLMIVRYVANFLLGHGHPVELITICTTDL